MLTTATKTFITVLIVLVILMAVFLVIERVIARGRNRKQRVFRKGWVTDVIYLFMTVMITKPILKVLLIIPLGLWVLFNLVPLETFQKELYVGFGPLSRQPTGLQLIQIYLLVDFLSYWIHRFFHGQRWWCFHAVHHSSEDLDWLGTVRVHPINELGNKFATVLPVLAMGYNPTVMLTAAPIMTLYAFFLHANINWDFGPFRWLIASPVFHRWHHSREPQAWDKNFAGVLPLWDILFGTYYMPRGRHPENFGICEPMSGHYAGQMWQPFASFFRRSKKVDPKSDPQ